MDSEKYCGDHKKGWCPALEQGFGKCGKYQIEMDDGLTDRYLEKGPSIHTWIRCKDCISEYGSTIPTPYT